MGRGLDMAALRPVGPGLPTADEWAALDAEQEAAGRAWVVAALPRRPPPGWTLLERTVDGLAARRKDGLRAIVSGAVEADGRRWLHLSLSRAKGLPTYHDLKAAKRDWLGDDRYAYQVFAPPSAHVSIGEVLHLWACADQASYLPDFTRGFATI